VSKSLFIVLLATLWCASQVAGQTVVRGTVRDASTGDALPAANIQVEGTYRGTISNREGLFELRLEEIPSTLIVRYIGYGEQRRSITQSSSTQQDFDLEPVVYEAETVVVTGEDPAIRIMREVIERKKIWRAELETYRAFAYNRFAVSNDTGIVSIMETVTEAYWIRIAEYVRS
jgi:hypothetical protein